MIGMATRIVGQFNAEEPRVTPNKGRKAFAALAFVEPGVVEPY